MFIDRHRHAKDEIAVATNTKLNLINILFRRFDPSVIFLISHICNWCFIYQTAHIMCSLRCGWFSQARTKAGDVNFKSEYIERFRDIINQAFSIGVESAAVKP